MIELSAPRSPDSLAAVSEQDAEVEVGFDAALNGKLLFPPFPRLLQGQRVPPREDQIREFRAPASFASEGFQSELDRLLLRYDEFNDSVTYLARVADLAALSGRLEQALSLANEAVQANPDPEYKYRLAEIAYFGSDIHKARSIWAELAAQGHMGAVLRMAQLSIAESDDKGASAWLDKAMRIDGTDWRGHLIAGALALGSGEHERAVRHFRMAMEERPRSVQIYYNLALAHVLAGSVKHAIRALRIAVGLNPFGQKALMAWADLSAHAGQSIPEASQALVRYAALHSDDKDAIERLAYLRYLLEDDRGARNALEKADERFHDAKITNNLGVLAARGKKLSQAIREFGRAIAIAAESPEKSAERTSDIATANLVTALINAGEFRRAEEVAAAYISLSSDDRYLSSYPTFRIAAGLVGACLNQGKTKKGIDLALNWIEKNIHPDLHSHLAGTLACYYTLVDAQLDRAHEFARQSFEIQSNRQPRDNTAWNSSVNNLAFVTIEQGKLDDAGSYLARLRSDASMHRYFHYATRGLLAIRRGHVDRGEGLYRLAISIASDRNTKSLLRQKLNWELGSYLARQGQTRRAIRFLAKVQKTRVTGVWTMPFVKRDAAAMLDRLRTEGRAMNAAGTAVRGGESAPSPRATYQDVLDAPAHRVAEIVAGALYTHPRPAMPHALASSYLGDELVGPFGKGRGGPGGWWIIDEPELHFGEDILVPDLAGWRRERMPDYPDTAYVTLAPDWVCEVLSDSTRKLDLHGKRPVYAREGVEHLWLVDPADRALEAFELRDGQWVLIAGAKDDKPVCIRPFDAVTFSLGNLWP